MSLKNAVIDRL